MGVGCITHDYHPSAAYQGHVARADGEAVSVLGGVGNVHEEGNHRHAHALQR